MNRRNSVLETADCQLAAQLIQDITALMEDRRPTIATAGYVYATLLGYVSHSVPERSRDGFVTDAVQLVLAASDTKESRA